MRSKSLCDQCGIYFSKVSNLNTHVEKVHKGLRWRCHLCGEYQVSKYSHVRHYESKHEGALPSNIDFNQRYANTKIDMSEKAKDALIKDLSEEVKKQRVQMKSLLKKLLVTLKENMELKAQKGIDFENAKQEYNNLLRDESEISDLDGSCEEETDDETENIVSGAENSDEEKEGEGGNSLIVMIMMITFKSRSIIQISIRYQLIHFTTIPKQAVLERDLV